jgi:cytochrome bd-type quinol oxidase subunit 2
MNLLVQNVYAAVATTVDAPTLPFTNLAQIFNVLINIVLGAGVALTIIFLILGGIQYIMSKGDQKAAQTARDWLTNAVIGFIVVIGAFTIRVILKTMLGVQNETGNIGDVINIPTGTN